MANTIIKGDFTINVLFDTTEDYDPIADYPRGLSIESMEMKPTATDDVIDVKERDTNGVSYFAEKAATAYDNKIKYFNTEKSGKRFFPFVDKTEVSSGVRLLITLK